MRFPSLKGLLSRAPVPYTLLPSSSISGTATPIERLTVDQDTGKELFSRAGWISAQLTTPRSASSSSKRPSWLGRLKVLLLFIAAGLVFSFFRWKSHKFQAYNGYWNGIAALVHYHDYVPEQHSNNSVELPYGQKAWQSPPFEPVVVNPYPDYNSTSYLSRHHPVLACYLDSQETIEPPDVFAYPGVPQNMTMNTFGSYSELGLAEDMCWDRFGRFSPYGYGYSQRQGGVGLADQGDKTGSEVVFDRMGKKIDYRRIDWGAAQERCYKKNKARFEHQSDGKERVKRHAYVLRAWTGYTYTEHQKLTIRAMINELSLKSGGEYDVYILLHVKDNRLPIWTDHEAYRRVIEENIPEEFWNLTVLWSERVVEFFYPGPFPDNVENDSGRAIHSVYRSSHFAIQWFSQQYPQYDFYWNWEMDLRMTGHYYQFNTAIGDWAKRQPRKGMWERAAKYYIPERHGSWAEYSNMIQSELETSGEKPIWGPVPFDNNGMIPSPDECVPPRRYEEDNFEWGVGEDADILTFTPLFNPANTTWVFSRDITGYSLRFDPPPRRVAIVAASRMSKRLLDMMHREVYRMHHSMFTEMFPPTVAFHHGMKGVSVPHPIYFDRQWDLAKLDQTFNYPVSSRASVFGGGEVHQLGNTFYYHSVFSGQLWRRWFGYVENRRGGAQEELAGSGRMCLRSTLLHPIKYETGPIG